MIKASALYMVVIVSLLIAVICTSLLSVAFYYRLEDRKKQRMDKLMLNLESASQILLSEHFKVYDQVQKIDLFERAEDSVLLSKEHWGVYDLGLAKAFQVSDTLKRSFLTGYTFTDPNAIYLADEDRPLSVSGDTRITGDGQLPKSGLKQSYVDGRPYSGKTLITGKISDSERDVPALEQSTLDAILKNLDRTDGQPFHPADSIGNSFFNDAVVYQLDVNHMDLTGLKLSGKVILVSDTTVIIDGSSRLQDVQIYAPVIRVNTGFKGSCQLFARDSILIAGNCTFDYPSFAGVFKGEEEGVQPKITLGPDVSFSGILFSYEKKRTELQTMISLAKNCLIKGEVFATGYVKLERGVTIEGKVSAKRFIMQTPATLYENYLIDLVFNRKLLSKYYLTAFLLKQQSKDQKILKWLY